MISQTFGVHGLFSIPVYSVLVMLVLYTHCMPPVSVSDLFPRASRHGVDEGNSHILKRKSIFWCIDTDSLISVVNMPIVIAVHRN